MNTPTTKPSIQEIAKAVKARDRAAAKVFAKSGWDTFVYLVALLEKWIETPKGQAMLEETGMDIVGAIGLLFRLQQKGLVKFQGEDKDEDNFSFEVIITEEAALMNPDLTRL